MLNGLQLGSEADAAAWRWLDLDGLKVRVRDGLTLINQAEREQFIIDLQHDRPPGLFDGRTVRTKL
jgi:hypothetical protein